MFYQINIFLRTLPRNVVLFSFLSNQPSLLIQQFSEYPHQFAYASSRGDLMYFTTSVALNRRDFSNNVFQGQLYKLEITLAQIKWLFSTQ